MLDGPSAPDIGIGFAPPRVESKMPQNFTPLPEFQKPTMTKPPSYQEPTTTPQIDQLMADILAQGKAENPQTAIKQVEKKLPQEVKKPQGFWVQLKEKIKNFFRNLFR